MSVLIKDKAQNICGLLERLSEFQCLCFDFCFSLCLGYFPFQISLENISVPIEMGNNLLPPNDHLWLNLGTLCHWIYQISDW